MSRHVGKYATRRRSEGIQTDARCHGGVVLGRTAEEAHGETGGETELRQKEKAKVLIFYVVV